MQRKIGNEIREIQQLLNRRIDADRARDTVKVSHIQTRILLYVAKSEQQIFQKDIEKELDVRRSTATEMLNILERDGMITREKVDFDARLKEIVLTEEAKRHIAYIGSRIQEAEMTLRRGIDTASLAIFFDVVDKIKDNLR